MLGMHLSLQVQTGAEPAAQAPVYNPTSIGFPLLIRLCMIGPFLKAIREVFK